MGEEAVLGAGGGPGGDVGAQGGDGAAVEEVYGGGFLEMCQLVLGRGDVRARTPLRLLDLYVPLK